MIYGNPLFFGGSGGGGTQPQNLIPQNATWAPGYFANGGTISSQSSTEKEIYESEYIPVQPGHEVLFLSRVSHSAPWVGVIVYNSNLGYITRITNANNFQVDSDYYAYYLGKLSTSAAFIRFSQRTYGLSTTAGVYDLTDLLDDTGVVVPV